MLIRANIFRELVKDAIKKSGWTALIVAEKAKVGKSTIYRLLNGSGESMREREVRAIAEALGLEIAIVHNNVVNLRKIQKSAAVIFPEGRENKLRGIIDMLREVDKETLEFAEELTLIAVSLQKNELIELRKVIEVLREAENKQLFIEKLQAIIKLLIPYQGVAEHADESGSKSGLSFN